MLWREIGQLLTTLSGGLIQLQEGLGRCNYSKQLRNTIAFSDKIGQ